MSHLVVTLHFILRLVVEVVSGVLHKKALAGRHSEGDGLMKRPSGGSSKLGPQSLNSLLLQ